MCFDKLNTNRPNSLNQKVFVFAFLINSFFGLAQIEAPNNFDGELLFIFLRRILKVSKRSEASLA